MQSTDDSALLRQYADNNSDDAFAALVTRHVNLVYSVALRQAGNPYAAQEITQAVFIILARKAASLRHDKALTSWLFQTTRLAANNFIRSETRRQRREGEAYMQSVLDETGTEVWSRIAPLLDSAVAGLREKDRQAILLRFYEGRNLRDVGLALGASEDAAERRVNRALEKLRKFFTKHGVSSTTAMIAGAISANSVQAAPVALAKSVTAMAIAKGAAASASTLILIQGTLKLMAWAKAKTAVVVGVCVLTAGATAVTVCKLENPVPAGGSVASVPALKDVFKKQFYVGAAVAPDQISGEDTPVGSLIKKQFSSITSGNCLKWENVHPRPGVYDFKQADQFVAFGEKNRMFIVGHVLIGRTQVPDWVFQDPEGKPVNREILLERMRDHIVTIMSRYKGRVNAWDVVNEAIGSDGKIQTKWGQIIGEDYIEKAFADAREADPNAELYFNGHNMLTPEAARSIVRVLKDIKGKGGRVDGVGVQAHWQLDYPSLDEIEAGIVTLSQSGVKVMITEMDVTVLPADTRTRVESNPYRDALPEAVQEKLAKRYGDLFGIFNKHHEKISRVTFWGVDDGQSWLNDYPIRGRTDYPLLFDRTFQPKPAFFAIVKSVKSNE
jgi:endo-1,4-beta-xylanase